MECVATKLVGTLRCPRPRSLTGWAQNVKGGCSAAKPIDPQTDAPWNPTALAQIPDTAAGHAPTPDDGLRPDGLHPSYRVLKRVLDEPAGPTAND
jgi:hypothetical protein